MRQRQVEKRLKGVKTCAGRLVAEATRTRNVEMESGKKGEEKRK